MRALIEWLTHWFLVVVLILLGTAVVGYALLLAIAFLFDEPPWIDRLTDPVATFDS